MKTIIRAELQDYQKRDVEYVNRRLRGLERKRNRRAPLKIDSVFVDKIDSRFAVTVCGEYNNSVFALTFCGWDITQPIARVLLCLDIMQYPMHRLKPK